MPDEKAAQQQDNGREIRSGKGVDVRPVVNLKPSEMPRPSGLVPKPQAQRPSSSKE